LKRELRLAVLAYPDDESLVFGGTIAKYAAEEIGTYLTAATSGSAGGSVQTGSAESRRKSAAFVKRAA
jgi:LmbE family N-acetylglucosaminyl deacetylase